MLHEIFTYPHPVLRKQAAVIEEITPEIRILAADMLETMYESDGIGLAAPQIGESLRLIVLDVTGPEKRGDPRIYVNPKLEFLGEEVETEEGCLSVEDYRAPVTRSERVKLTALDLDGNPLNLEAEGVLAICLQHECDHLDGRLFIDRISRLKRNLYDAKVKKWARLGR